MTYPKHIRPNGPSKSGRSCPSRDFPWQAPMSRIFPIDPSRGILSQSITSSDNQWRWKKFVVIDSIINRAFWVHFKNLQKSKLFQSLQRYENGLEIILLNFLSLKLFSCLKTHLHFENFKSFKFIRRYLGRLRISQYLRLLSQNTLLVFAHGIPKSINFSIMISASKIIFCGKDDLVSGKCSKSWVKTV